MFDEETKNFAQQQEQLIEALKYRAHGSDEDRGKDRDELSRDYARVLYSSSFRRLQGKMQLLGVDPSRFNRNRLTHSLEVAQIARTIAHSLGLKSTVVVETASLSHDIGNPPFGHSGEVILNELCAGHGGFEGNAQTMRILRTLEKKDYNFQGLNLTIRTLLAVTKYFNNRVGNPKKFLYDDDYTFLKAETEKHNLETSKSIDAQIMDLSDEIAYAAHDLEDALSFGIISLGEIVHEFKISDKFNPALETITQITQQVQKYANKGNRFNSSEEYAILMKKELTSTIVNTLVRDIGVKDHSLDYKNHKLLAEGLKKLLFKAILRKKDVLLYEKKGEKIIRGLFEVYMDDSFNKGLMLLPPELRTLEDTPKARAVADYISGMMDSFAAQEYERYFGKNSLQALYKSTPT